MRITRLSDEERDAMLLTYIKLPDGTVIGYSPERDDASVLVSAVRATKGGFDVALAKLPWNGWLASEGYTGDELISISEMVKGNAALIRRLAQEETARLKAREAKENEAAHQDSGASADTPLDDDPTTGTSRKSKDAPPQASEGETVGRDSRNRVASHEGPHTGAASRGTASTGQPKAAGESAVHGAEPNEEAEVLNEYQQAASAVLDAASLLGRVAPMTKVGRAVNLAMPAARSVVTAAPQIVEKAAPAVTQAAKAAPKMAEKAARGLGRMGSKLASKASEAAGDVADAAKRAVAEYKREQE